MSFLSSSKLAAVIFSEVKDDENIQSSHFD
jgi:hypothetical protein